MKEPIHTELIGELSISGAPKALVEGHFYGTAHGQLVEEGIDLFVAAAPEAQGDGIAFFELLAHHIGPQEHEPVAGEDAVHDIGACNGWQLGGHWGFRHPLEGELASQAFLVESHGFPALAIEI
jgi:hypothetical protein